LALARAPLASAQADTLTAGQTKTTTLAELVCQHLLHCSCIMDRTSAR
jgi:hypothetical protein